MRKKRTPTKRIPKSKKLEGIVLRIKDTRVMGNEYENKVLRVCSKNRFPFAFKDGFVGYKIPDFINRKKKRIIEVYNPERSDEEVHARLLAFHIKAFKVKQLVKHDFSRPDWKPFLIRIIKGFLSHD